MPISTRVSGASPTTPPASMPSFTQSSPAAMRPLLRLLDAASTELQMHSRRAALFVMLLLAAALHDVGAQTLRDALKARRERQQAQSDAATAAPDGLDAAEGAAG